MDSSSTQLISSSLSREVNFLQNDIRNLKAENHDMAIKNVKLQENLDSKSKLSQREDLEQNVEKTITGAVTSSSIDLIFLNKKAHFALNYF